MLKACQQQFTEEIKQTVQENSTYISGLYQLFFKKKCILQSRIMTYLDVSKSEASISQDSQVE